MGSTKIGYQVKVSSLPFYISYNSQQIGKLRLVLKKKQVGKLLYNVLIQLYAIAFRLFALFNRKAALGVQGRKRAFVTLQHNAGSPIQPVIWMHCASLGEFEQGRPVLEMLKKQYPATINVLTFFSASGYEVVKNYQGADQVYYLPFDNAANAKKMVKAINPTLVLWIKYEFWYHYLHTLRSREIPVMLVSGIFRPGHPFFQWYGNLWRSMLQCFTVFFVQNETSRKLLATLDLQDKVMLTGDTRFDRVIAIAENYEDLPLVTAFCGNSKVIVAGSTWEDDEAELVHYVKANPQVKFIIAPHETDDENLKDVKKAFPNSVFYSELSTNYRPPVDEKGEQVAAPNVLIIDNVGMLSRLYRYAQIAYVGGGFGADGVHNVLEAAVYGKPVIYGPEFEKFTEAIGLVDCGGGITIQNALELESTLNELWETPSLLKEKGTAARQFVYSRAGASGKILQYIQENRLLIN